ncbi:MAG: glycoside hydrolase family 31 protein [Porphyromonas sp.]|nr:glycoside hydrolase family 31 protein [Porphyromonas sp.]
MAKTYSLLWRLFILPMVAFIPSIAVGQSVVDVTKTDGNTVSVTLDNGQVRLFDFYSDHIVRIYQDPKGRAMHDPVSEPPASILVSNPRSSAPFAVSVDRDGGDRPVIATEKVMITIDKESGLMTVTDKQRQKVVLREVSAPEFKEASASLYFNMQADEYFYGGGVQNGRFSHRGQSIAIENSNNWVDGGVASPTPFYWSTAGYGILAYTFKPGWYDFGSQQSDRVALQHSQDYADYFLMVNESPDRLIADYYSLTGKPALLPKFGYLQGHLNAYNRDYWLPTDDTNRGILMEDGKYYIESQKDNGGVKESLNGEKENYLFSARAVIDRYARNDMPLGWILPNDGYGAGYGQTETLDGNIENLKQFGDYARSKGVEIGLWTQSDLHPKEGVEPLLQRDLAKEVGVSGVRLLKTDVAWVGPGYSFGLNGIADAAEIMIREGRGARPFIITLDGWAGTQRYASVWSGDQTGGDWEYIRFHIPTYIGSGLSGIPFISSDMDGIFGGKNLSVNVRDFQWKTFTPMQLNMDGWGTNPKYPMALGESATSINRAYLKLKSMLLPYAYSSAVLTLNGTPLMRPMFYEEMNPYTLGSATRYQFMYGPDFIVAPIYKATAMDSEGNDIRHSIYLPEGLWYDFFSGEPFEGGRIINSFEAPLWKLPVFVKSGAVVPYTQPFNTIGEMPVDFRGYALYGGADGAFEEYDDDGRTVAYTQGEAVKTSLEMQSRGDKLAFVIGKAVGMYDGFESNKRTEIRLNVSQRPKKIKITANGRRVRLQQVDSRSEYDASLGNVYLYDPAPELNRFSTEGSEAAKVSITGNPVVMIKTAPMDVAATELRLEVDGYRFEVPHRLYRQRGTVSAPEILSDSLKSEATKMTITWEPVERADFYEMEHDGMLYSTIRENHFTIEDLVPESDYTFRLRSVNSTDVSDWVTMSLRTAKDPYELALKEVLASTTSPNQPGQGIAKLFDGDLSTNWHTDWDKAATPFDINIDMRGVVMLDSMEYYPRKDGGNGTLLVGSIAYSEDRKEWSQPIPFEWTADGELKTFVFDDKPEARYLRIHVERAVGRFGSGREMYIYRVPGTTIRYQGDINRDRRIDENDFTSYMNYVGLRDGDADFGYVSVGDINRNGLIDAYDISTVSTVIDGGVSPSNKVVKGRLDVVSDLTSFAEGDTISITVSGSGLDRVNALSFGLPYDASMLQYIGLEVIDMKDMVNLTKDRLHSDGTKELFPTFVNRGNNFLLEDGDLFVITFRAKKAGKWNPDLLNALLVDRDLNTLDPLKPTE